jgi:hypothetical protein
MEKSASVQNFPTLSRYVASLVRKHNERPTNQAVIGSSLISMMIFGFHSMEVAKFLYLFKD